MPLFSTWTGGGGDVEYPRLSTRGGEGVKIGSKLVHVVVECPLGKLIHFDIFCVALILGSKNIEVCVFRGFYGFPAYEGIF